MTEVEKLQRAKDYMDMLADGVDPISGETLENDTILNNVRLSRCFFYVSDILRQVIDNGGVGKRAAVKQSDLPPFSFPEDLRGRVPVTKEPIMIRAFVERINDLVDTTAMRKLKTTAFTEWLVEKGFLVEEIVNDKKRKKSNQAGQELGIDSEIREGQYGKYPATLYNENAQRFLLDNLDLVIAFANRENI